MKIKGLIAIDIDGTLTAVRDALSQQVIDYLHELFKNDWKFLFVTGRTLDWASKLLEVLPFEYYLSVFNGAYTLECPQKKVLKKRYLSFEEVFHVVNLVRNEDVGIAFYGAPDRDNRSFLYRRFASHVLFNHLMERAKAVWETWKEVDSVTDLPLDSFAAMRLFCLPHTATKVSKLIEEQNGYHAPMMKDSYDSSFSVVQVTRKEVSKGQALQYMSRHLGKLGKIIACGDDHNDISMLEKADLRVVMASAPSEVLRLADIIAPPAKDDGIIIGLKNALLYLEKH